MTTAEKRRLETGTKVGPQSRNLVLARAQPGDSAGAQAAGAKVPGLDVDARTLVLTFSSEAPVERWFGAEVLSHERDAPDLTRLNDGAPLLFNHNMDDVIGVVVEASVGGDRKGHATVRFANTERATEVMNMVADGILRNVSFMYQVAKYRIDSDEEDPYYDPDAVYTATRWMAYEISIVSVPADQTVGVGRALAVEERSVEVEAPKRAEPRAAAAAPTVISSKGKPMEHGTNGGAGNTDIAIAERLAKELSPEHLRRLLADTEQQRQQVDAGVQARAVADARADETNRVREIEALGLKMGWSRDKIGEMVQSDKSVADVRGLALTEKLASGAQQPVGGSGNVDMTQREKSRYSMLRAVQAALGNDWTKAGFEREVSAAIAKAAGRDVKANAFLVPTNLPFCPDGEHARALAALNPRFAQRLLQQRAVYQVGTAGQGGNLVETTLLDQQFIEVLRNVTVTSQLGARFLTGLVGNVNIPRQNAQTSTYWVAESGAPTESEATFDQVQLRPKTLGALSKMSRLMMMQSTPAIEMIARQDLMAVMALGIDLAALSGSGTSNQPTGIVNQSGVGSVVGGTNGANWTFDHFIQLYSSPKIANAPQANLGYAINAKTYGYLSTLKSSTGSYLWMPQGGITQAPGDTLRGYSYAVSNQLRATLTKGTASGICSEAIFGNWQELFIGEWGVTEIMANPYDATGFTTGDVLLRAFQTVDVGVRHAASFAVMSDGLTPGF